MPLLSGTEPSIPFLAVKAVYIMRIAPKTAIDAYATVTNFIVVSGINIQSTKTSVMYINQSVRIVWIIFNAM